MAAPISAVPPATTVVVPEVAPKQAIPEKSTNATTANESPDGVIHWTASEFIAHQKSAGWYFRLGVAAVFVAAVIWLLTRDKISSSAILIAALVLGAYGARKPRQLTYELDSQGLRIGEKYYSYEEFRSFAIIPEGAFSSVVFMPLKRFAPLTTIYYEPDDEERIVDLLTDRLPIEDRQHDAIDRFLHRIRY